MKNPFKYGDPVEAPYYFDRPELKKTTLNFIEGHINIVILGPRRYGKTSFLLDLMKTLESKDFKTLYVDIFNITTQRDFLNQLLTSVTREKPILKKIQEWLKNLPGKFQPALEFSEDSASLKMNVISQAHEFNESEVKQMIERTLDSLESLSKKVVLFFDEFQKIGQIEDEGWLEATIRSIMQRQKNVHYVFTGSRHGVIHDMFNNAARPFYRSCQLIDFPPLGPAFTDWIVERFESSGISCDRFSIDYLRKQLADTPNYVQMACFHLVAHEVKKVDQGAVDEILTNITSQNSYAYQTLLNSLTPIQQRVLRLAACEEKAIYTQEYRQKYEIPTGAHLAQGIKSLKAKQILDESTKKGMVVFDDPLFKIWLENTFSD